MSERGEAIRRAEREEKDAARTNSEPGTASHIHYIDQDNNDDSNCNAVEERNKKLEQELFRLEQTAALREEVSRRLREKIDGYICKSRWRTG